MKRPRALFVLDSDAYELAYGPEHAGEIARLTEVIAEPQTKKTIAKRPELLEEAEVIFSGWGAPLADEVFLETAAKLKVVFYAAGAVGSWMTEAAWERGLTVTTASAANAVPVAEYALAAILFSLKHGWGLARETRRQRTFVPRDGAPGCYERTVGLVSLGIIARTLLKLLRPFDLQVVAYDPYVSADEAASLGVELVSLEEVFRRSEVVSIHTPSLPETNGMITGAHVRSMKAGATLVNTARGAVIREEEMLKVLAERPDLQAVLDTVDPEPPGADSPLYSLENVVMTPHIAGSVGHECRRMGRYMVEELKRYVRGEPLRWVVTREETVHSSHRPVVTVRRPLPVAAVAKKARAKAAGFQANGARR